MDIHCNAGTATTKLAGICLVMECMVSFTLDRQRIVPEQSYNDLMFERKRGNRFIVKGSFRRVSIFVQSPSGLLGHKQSKVLCTVCKLC